VDSFEYRWIKGNSPDGILKVPFGYTRTVADGMVIERDVAVAMRDGVKIYIDLFRPENAKGDLPAIIAWSPYGKSAPKGGYERFENNGGVKPEWISKYAAFETPDPLYWCRQGYAFINADSRGVWNSEGDATFWSSDEAEDFYDLIEWSAAQAWSNGKVGAAGVSYFAIVQWQVAALQPPHLAAINPWEGYSDSYRERAKHGGIPEISFMPHWLEGNRYSRGRVEDVMAMIEEHPFFDAYWKSKAPDLSKIVCPAYVVASWADQGLHTRGTLEGFKQMSSKHKWLEVHGRRKWEYYMRPDNVEKQRVFFDHFLKAPGDELPKWPKVNVEVRERFYVGEMRAEKEWPIARTQYTPLYLASEGTMARSKPAAEAQVRYDAREGRAVFDHRFDADTELTGHMKLKLRVSTTEGDDMDLFVTVDKLDREGRPVPFTYFSVFEDGPVALGWLRVSHRELDPERSTPYQPWYLHQRELRLKPDEIVAAEIEILPSGTLFRRGESIRVTVQGRETYKPKQRGPEMKHGPLRNRGEHVIHCGGKHDSHLLVPVIPP
jgi:predicted acyl esterase